MAIVSPFELIVQRLVPLSVAKTVSLPAPADPISVEAYFLQISNTSNTIAQITLQFTANPNTSGGPSNFNGGGIVPSGKNFGEVTALINEAGAISFLKSPVFTINSNASATAKFSVPPQGSYLFLLQPDVSPLKDFDQQTDDFSYELRGYVEIDSTPGTSLLLSPQIRGTFFELGQKGELLAPKILLPETLEKADNKVLLPYAQQAYSLIVPGSSLVTF